MGAGVWCCGCGVPEAAIGGLGSICSGSGLRVECLGFRVQCSGKRGSSLRFRIMGMVWSSINPRKP